MRRKQAMWTGFWSLLLQFVRLGITLILFLAFARFLPLDELGAYSAAFAVTQLSLAFVRGGVLEVVIASERVDDRFIDSAFLASALIGLSMSALVFTCSMFTLFVFDETAAGSFLAALSLMPLIESIGIVPEAVLRKSLKFKALTIRTFFALILALFATFVAVGMGLGVEALIIFNVSSSILITAITLMISKSLPKGYWSGNEVLSVLKPASSIALSGFTTKSIVPLSQIAVSLLAGFTAAGAYAIAQRIITFVNAILVEPVKLTSLPILSRLRDNEEGRKVALFEAASLCSTILAPLYLGMAATADILLPLLIGENGIQAVPILEALSWHFAPLVVSMMSAQLLLVLGQSGQVLKFTFIQSLSAIVVSFAVAPFGAVWVAWAYVLRAYVLTPYVLRQARLYGNVAISDYLKAIVPPFAIGFIMWIMLLSVKSALTDFELPGIVSLVILIVCGAIVYSILMMIFAKSHFEILRNSIMTLIDR